MHFVPVVEPVMQIKKIERKRKVQIDQDGETEQLSKTVRKKATTLSKPANASSNVTESFPTIPHEALQRLFDEFWDLEFNDPIVAAAFFSLITKKNCTSLGVPDYFEKILEACTLANIKVWNALECNAGRGRADLW